MERDGLARWLGVDARCTERRVLAPLDAQLTAIDMLLGVQVRNLVGLSWFFANDFFFYCMIGFSSLTLLYLCAFPKDRRALDDDD